VLLNLVLALVVGTLVVALIGLRRAQAEARAGWQAALANERRFSEAFHASPVPLALTSLVTHRITEVNDAYARMIGWSREEMTGSSGADLGMYPAELRATLTRRLRRSGIVRNVPVTMTHKDGTLRDIVLSLDIVEIDGEPHSLSTIIDQTEHKRTMAELQSVDARLRELAATIDEVFWVRAPDGRLLYVSPAYETLWGVACDSVQANPMSWLDAVLPEDRDKLTAPGPTREFRIVRPDGSIRWVRTKSFPVRDNDGNVIRFAGVAADVTENRALEEQLRHAQKMESLGMLAGGIAHDFNNLLAVISSCSGLLAESIPPDDGDRELVDDIEGAVVRAAALTRQLLAFSRKQVSEPVVLDVNLVVNDTRKLLRRMVGVDVDVITSLEPDLRTVRIDRNQLVQVILNLAVNARDAMSGRGTLRIATRNVDDGIAIEVTDNGSGMSSEVQARACEPFFTTKAPGKGTGMGLAVVHGIVDQAKGRIDIASQLGSGTTFRIALPAVGGRIETPRNITEDTNRGVETILIVDDDDYVRRATARALRSRGYTVFEASNGRAALLALPTESITLLLTDLVMPGMNGRVLAEAARARFPDLKTLYMTGYTNDEVVHVGLARGEVDLIEKPFTIKALAAKVRTVLDDATESPAGNIEPVGPTCAVGNRYSESPSA